MGPARTDSSTPLRTSPEPVNLGTDTTASHAPGRAAFAETAAARLREAPAAMTDLLAGVGLSGARAIDFGRRLGLDKTLAWRIARFIEGTDPVEAARHLPGAAGVEIVIKAAAAQGAAAARIDAVRQADQRLREFVGRHAGDRRSFEAMLSGSAPDERILLEERRAHYRAGSAIWGVRARVQLLLLALRPSPTADGMLDLVQLGGLIDLERLRPDVPWIVRRLRASARDESKTLIRMQREPLDAADGVGGDHTPASSLITEYCSQPLPQMRRFEGDNGWLYDEIAPGPVGRRSAVTCIMGEIYRAALPARRGPDNTVGRYTLTVRTPVECVLFDLLVHRSLSHFGPARLSVAGLIEDRPRGAPQAAGGLLMPPTDAQRLGTPSVVQTPRLAAYPAMAAGALRRAGWGGVEEFVGYRAEMEYPPAPCDLVMECGIGEDA